MDKKASNKRLHKKGWLASKSHTIKVDPESIHQKINFAIYGSYNFLALDG